MTATEEKSAPSVGFSGLKVVSFESRRAFEMESLIVRNEGVPLVAPSMREIPFEVNAEAVEFGRKVIEGKADIVIFMTGVGTRFLVQVIEKALNKRKFLEELSAATVVARGPKPVSALKEINIAPAIVAPEPNTWREVFSALTQKTNLKDKRVFVQEYGIPSKGLIDALKAAGARVSRVPVYRWALPDDLNSLRKAILAVCDGKADILLFTNATQIHHVLQIAAEDGLEASFREGLARAVVASIGPVMTKNLRDLDLPVDFEAEKSIMGLFVKEAAEKCPEILVRKRTTIGLSAGPVRAKIYPPQPFDKNAVQNSLMLKACRGEKVPRTPVWIMRQAGRYMKEYRDVRAKVGFLELCKNSDLACEVTVTAQERLGVDAAILFSDILLILEPMGVGLEYVKGDGPVIHRPVRAREDIENLREENPKQSLSFVMDAVKKIRSALKPDIPLIGFAGAPFTLASYAIEGKSSDNYLHTKSLMYRDPGAWNLLMEKFTGQTAAYLNAQIEAGAQIVQVFDSWVGALSPMDYRELVFPHMKKLFASIAPSIPIIHFGTGTAGILDLIKEAGGSVIGLDWRVNLGEQRDRLGEIPVQGNLDPLVLLSGKDVIRRKVKQILDQNAGRPGHIFNLGHGILPQTPVENAVALVDAVRELSGI